ncbi:V-type proton ATPase subunit H-like isoform X2 [Ptychodera flava]|uniref:V-type proton ATPase subunit H-like isoform X2 n=1 Tax=Ptychodera flava TaxID=63121 RepID=UPI00396A6F55
MLSKTADDRGQMISQEEFTFIREYDNATNKEQRDQVLQRYGPSAAKIFLSLMGHISKDQTVQYILTMVDDMLQEDHDRVSYFFDHAKKAKTTPWAQFLNMLNRQDKFVINQAARVIAKLACWGKEKMNTNDLNYYFSWIRGQLTAAGNEYLPASAGCLQMVLRYNVYREAFMETEGMGTIVSVLGSRCGFQIQYQLTFCIWMVTYNAALTAQVNKYNVIPVLADILHESAKEKVTRIILATFRNLLEKPEEKEIVQDNALAMIQCKVLKQLEVLEGQKFEDSDITDDIEYISEKLRDSVEGLSSFDEYSQEVKSGRLEWSPVHKSEKFWRENAARLNEKNYEMLKILIKLLETSKDSTVLAVSAHDIGEYVRHYPRGKHNIEQLGGKELVMTYMGHEDPTVRYEALLAVQKLMVHNWEYLGKALEQQK